METFAMGGRTGDHDNFVNFQVPLPTLRDLVCESRSRRARPWQASQATRFGLPLAFASPATHTLARSVPTHATVPTLVTRAPAKRCAAPSRAVCPPRPLVMPPSPCAPVASLTPESAPLESETSASRFSGVVAVDVDEVLCSYVAGFRKFLQRERPDGPLDQESVFQEAHSQNSPWRLQFAISGGLDELDAVPGASEAVSRLRAAGVRLEAVTTRPPVMRESTESLLLKLFPPNSFAAVHHVSPGDKGRTCNAIGALVLVDDQLGNILDAASCGVTAVLFDLDGHHRDDSSGAPRFETWAGVCNFILSTLECSSSNVDDA